MTPAYRILADDNDITTAIRHRLLSLRVTDETGYQSNAVEIELDDRGGAIHLPRKGATLEVDLGYEETGTAKMGSYTVDEVELSGPPDTLTIRAKAANMLSTLKQHKTRSWDDVTIAELVDSIAADHGLEPRVSESIRAITARRHIDQTEESDMHLLKRLSEDYDAESKQAGRQLLFVKRGQGKSATGQQVTPATLSREQTSDHRVTLADRGKFQAVRAHWYDMETGERTEVQAGDGEPAYTLRENYIDEVTARQAARSKLDTLQRGTATPSLTLKQGSPVIGAETPLTLTGFREGVNGRWIATRVTHEISSSGDSTQVEAETPDPRPMSARP